jgi:hypothetical protein
VTADDRPGIGGDFEQESRAVARPGDYFHGLCSERRLLMLRIALCSVAVMALFLGTLVADNKDNKDNKNKQGQHATITKVDSKAGTVTVKMKDKAGKESERTFKLTGEVRMFDDNGKNVRLTDIDIFRSGDYVLVVERDGKLQEIHKEKGGKTPSSTKPK